jgi:3-hydroxyisobutyrate dehydrogenase-like beta-hydroxyacid dehydrogenase
MHDVGFLGFGRMGRPMAQNLAAAGFRVAGWNRTAGKAPPSVAEKRSIAEVARECPVVATMLSDDAAVESAAGELYEHLPRGATHLGMSTISVALAKRLVAEHAARGQRYVAAPVFGRPEAAEKKLLFIVTGGETAPLAPILGAMGKVSLSLAEPWQASLAKLCGNFLILSVIESLGEALALAEKAGIDPEALMSFLGSTFLDAPAIRGYGGRIARTEFQPAGFALVLGLKDANLMLKAAEDLRVPLPLAALARDHFLAALARGREDWDWGGLASSIRESAGLTPVRRD